MEVERPETPGRQFLSEIDNVVAFIEVDEVQRKPNTAGVNSTAWQHPERLPRREIGVSGPDQAAQPAPVGARDPHVICYECPARAVESGNWGLANHPQSSSNPIIQS